jgi:hypothetical protein
MKTEAHKKFPGLVKGWELAKQNRKPENYHICLVCGKQFHRNHSGGRGKFCSRKCKGIWQRTHPPLGLIEHQKRTGIYKTCVICGKQFYCYPSLINKYKCCSIECSYKYRKQTYRGEKSPAWRGGKMKLAGYVYVKKEDHPLAHSDGYVAEHRLVMENVLGRYLSQYEDVHHINGVKDDNREENLMIVLHNDHHQQIKCPYCQKEFLLK